MFRTGKSTFAIAMTLGASLAVASIADAGGYANNKCISKKQGALSKYVKSVGKAWDKNPSDSVARDAAIGAAFTKLSGSWTKEEGKAADKFADCTAATDTVAALAGTVDASIAALAGAMEDYGAVAGYVSGAIKARSKFIKDPTKDPGKAKQEAGRTKASEKYLVTPTVTVATAASTLENDLYLGTTTAPNYPSAFQSIVPGAEVNYGKDVLTPTCVDGDPYMFWARKGTSNNVLMYYQGGGACWNATSCFVANTCKRTATLGDNPDLGGVGFADYDNPANPFSDWSVVFVTYCTCDVHWGENHKDYNVNMAGQDARHFGRVNAAVAEKFAREHFVDPEKVFVTGSSAGSYGAIMNSYWLMRDVWPQADFAVLGDAGVGVITNSFLEPNKGIDNWGIENNFPDDLEEYGVVLPISNLSLVDLIDAMAQKYPNNRFANYDASYDGGSGSQCQFFQVMNNPTTSTFVAEWPKWWDQACDWGACMREFKAENSTRAPNYKYFTGAGTRHTMFGSDKVYTETKSTNEAGDGVTIAAWVQAMVDDTAGFENVDCNNTNGDCNLTNSCQGGANAGDFCSSNVDCNVGATCVGGTNPGTLCPVGNECTGGGFCPFCQHDPDTANAPFNNDDTVNCPPTACPCDAAGAKCSDDVNEGLPCTTNADCPGAATCESVKCPVFTP
jgi:hypothetical protein